MVAHGINFPSAQAGSLAPFPEKAGAAAGLFGFISMLGAFFTGMAVGASHDGTILPLALISATVAVALFVSARVLARHGHAAQH
jgi:DHA1 family bicyclomycin/chloramphenicol resistance-like MFS transporter